MQYRVHFSWTVAWAVAWRLLDYYYSIGRDIVLGLGFEYQFLHAGLTWSIYRKMTTRLISSGTLSIIRLYIIITVRLLFIKLRLWRNELHLNMIYNLYLYITNSDSNAFDNITKYIYFVLSVKVFQCLKYFQGRFTR